MLSFFFAASLWTLEGGVTGPAALGLRTWGGPITGPCPWWLGRLPATGGFGPGLPPPTVFTTPGPAPPRICTWTCTVPDPAALILRTGCGLGLLPDVGFGLPVGSGGGGCLWADRWEKVWLADCSLIRGPDGVRGPGGVPGPDGTRDPGGVCGLGGVRGGQDGMGTGNLGGLLLLGVGGESLP